MKNKYISKFILLLILNLFLLVGCGECKNKIYIKEEFILYTNYLSEINIPEEYKFNDFKKEINDDGDLIIEIKYTK